MQLLFQHMSPKYGSTHLASVITDSGLSMVVIVQHQGVVTYIGAILRAATGVTICDRLNLAVTP